VIAVSVHNRQSAVRVDARRVRRAVRAALAVGGVGRGEVSVAIVDDPTIQDLNRRFLQHDYPTDVLSFALDRQTDLIAGDRIAGEIIASGDTALANAARFGWPPADELLLYVVHGALHLAGFDDTTPVAADKMRHSEREVLSQFGLSPRYDAEE
jgi:probable rRNA maturation factor